MILRKKLYIKGMELKQNKTKRVLTLIAPLAIGFSLCDCGSDNVAGGGPSGTEAGNAITAQILIANAPAANARVKLVEHNSLNGIEDGYTAIANDSGFITIEKVPVGNYTMEATLNESAVQWPVDIKDTVNEVNLGAHSLQKSVYIGGSVANFFADSISESFKNMNGFVKFSGLDHSAIIKEGKFEVKGLPAGKLNLVFIPESAADTVYVPVATNAGDSITTLKPTPQEKETLLIEDFEDGDHFHLLAADYTYNMGGMWAIGADQLSINDTTNPAASVQIIPKAFLGTFPSPFIKVIQDDGNGGKEVHFTALFPDTTIYNKNSKKGCVTLTMTIGYGNIPYDITPIDTISFEAWGKSTSTYFVISDGTQKNVDVTLGGAAYTIGKKQFELTQEKKTHKIALDDILPDAEKRKSVTSIGIVFYSDTEIHFDNLKFIGEDLLYIWKTKE